MRQITIAILGVIVSIAIAMGVIIAVNSNKGEGPVMYVYQDTVYNDTVSTPSLISEVPIIYYTPESSGINLDNISGAIITPMNDYYVITVLTSPENTYTVYEGNGSTYSLAFYPVQLSLSSYLMSTETGNSSNSLLLIIPNSTGIVRISSNCNTIYVGEYLPYFSISILNMSKVGNNYQFYLAFHIGNLERGSVIIVNIFGKHNIIERIVVYVI
ncbi:hypothetical protein HS7_09170 [Sulfolobales archaeon HS-7]|nr:hypothetical protein HS7_09170 [Sulfolobales archaeon HS-7]